MSTKITTDIYFAAALLALGAKLEKTDKTDPRHMEFHFSSPMRPAPLALTGGVDQPFTANLPLTQIPVLNLEGLESEWVNKSLTINAFEFAEAIKRMKSVVHSR